MSCLAAIARKHSKRQPIFAFCGGPNGRGVMLQRIFIADWWPHKNRHWTLQVHKHLVRVLLNPIQHIFRLKLVWTVLNEVHMRYALPFRHFHSEKMLFSTLINLMPITECLLWSGESWKSTLEKEKMRTKWSGTSERERLGVDVHWITNYKIRQKL